MKKLMLISVLLAVGVSMNIHAVPLVSKPKVVMTTKLHQGTFTNICGVSQNTAYKQLEKYVLRNNTAVTVTNVMYTTTMGGIRELIGTNVLTTGASVVVYPVRVYTDTVPSTNAVPWIGKDFVHIGTLITNTPAATIELEVWSK